MADVQTPAKTWMYHPTEAPTGQLFDTAHAPSGDGWVDTPAGFAPPVAIEEGHTGSDPDAVPPAAPATKARKPRTPKAK